MADEIASLQIKVSALEAAQAASTLQALESRSATTEKSVAELEKRAKAAGKEFAEFEKRTKEAEARMKEMEGRAASASKAFNEYEKRIKAAEDAQRKQAEAAAQAAKKLEEAQKKAENEPRAWKQARLGLEEYKTELSAVIAERERLERVKARTSGQQALLARETEAVRKLKEELKLVPREAEKADRAIEKIGGTSDALKGKIVGFTTALIGIGTASSIIRDATVAWNEYDKSIKQVNSIANFDKGEFKDIRAEVLELSRTMGIDAKQAAEGLFATIQDGIDKTKSIDFLKVAAETAQGGATTIDTAVNAITNVINAYGMEAESAREISDKLFATVLDGKATFEELGSGLAGTTVPAAALGVKFEEVLAMTIAITKQGTSAAEGFTQITSAITSLLNPSDEMLAVFKELNVETAQQAVAQYGLTGVLEKAREMYEGNSAALVKAVGRVEALKAVYATTGEKANAVAKGMEAVNKSAGSTAKAAEANANNLTTALNSVKVAVVQLAEALENNMGIFTGAANILRSLSDLVTSLAGNDISFGTDTLLKNADGGMGYLQIDERIAQLEKYKKYIAENTDFMGDVQYGNQPWQDSRGSELPPEFGRLSGRILGVNNGAEVAADIQGEIDKLIEKKEKIAELNKAEVDYAFRMKNIQADQTISEEERAARAEKARQDLEIELKAREDLKKAVEEQTKSDEAAAVARSKAAELQLEQEKEGAKLMEEQAKSIDEAWNEAQKEEAKLREKNDREREKAQQDELDHIRKLGTNKRQELELEKAKIIARKAQNNLSAEDVKLADAAIANLEKQLMLLDENGEAIKRARVVDESKLGGRGSRSSFNMMDFAPIFEAPTNNQFEQLEREEQQVRDSYVRRQQEILEIEGATEQQRAALQAQANEQMLKANEYFTAERNKATLGLAEDFFGNLSAMAGAFGKKGFKFAQAAAIAETTVNTYASATAAYKSLATIPYVGPVLGAAAAGAAIASGIANIQKIRSTEYSGAYAAGGLIPAGKYGLVGEAGPEFVQGPAVVKSAVASRDALADRGGSGGEKPWTINNYNLPGQTTDFDVDMEERVITASVRRMEDKLTKEADSGGGKVFPTFNRRYGVKRAP